MLLNSASVPRFLGTALTAACLLIGVSAGAGPVARGNSLVAGSFSFSSAGDDFYTGESGERTQEWTVRPGGGHFIADGWALGFHLEGRWFTQGDIRRTAYAMGPTLHRYWDTTGGEDPAGRVLPYLGAGYLWGQLRDESPAGNSKHNSGELSLDAGLAWMLSSQVATDISVNFRTGHFIEKIPVDGVERSSDRWSLHIGIKAFLP